MELATLFNAMPGNIAQGLLWGIMALGVYLTFKVLNFADLTVDGSFATGGAVAVVLITGGVPAPIALVIAFFAGVVAGFATGILHTVFGIPDILAGILTQIALYSINLNIMSGSANMAVNVLKYNLVVTLREIPHTIIISLISVAVIIGLMYWYLGTAQGSALRATGNNPL